MSPSISSQLDETIAQLDRLHQPARERRARDFEALQAIVAVLGQPFDPSLEDETPELGRGLGPRYPQPQTAPSGGGALPFGFELPTRTTLGGDFGPAVRRRLIADAIDKGGGW